MAEPFDPATFVNMIGEKLVMEFQHAGAAAPRG